MPTIFPAPFCYAQSGTHRTEFKPLDQIERMLDSELGAKDLINNRMAYVFVSRGAHDARIFTSDREKLPEALSRDVSHQSAHAPEARQEPEQQRKRLTGRELMDQYLRHWPPLNEALPSHEAKQFAWKQESGTMQIYEHMQTGRHLYIDGRNGQFHDRNRDPITAKEGLDHAMPEDQAHSHSRDLLERSIEHQEFGKGM